jgi:hypothetical protein
MTHIRFNREVFVTDRGCFALLNVNLAPFYALSKNYGKLLLASSCLSVRPHQTTRLPLDGFSRNFTFHDSSKITVANSNSI